MPTYYDCPQKLGGDKPAVTVGSDLVVAVDAADSTLIGAYDSDGTFLGALATSHDPEMLARLFPIAADTAVRLFPHHLRKPLEA